MELPQRVIEEAWHEYRYPQPATGEPTPRFKRVIAVVNFWLENGAVSARDQPLSAGDPTLEVETK